MKENLRQFAWCAYDHLGGLVLVNLVWSGISLPWIVAGLLLWGIGVDAGGGMALCGSVLAVDLVLLSPPSVLLFLAGRRWTEGREARIGDLIRRLPGYAARAQGLGLMGMGLHFLLLGSAVFYYRLSNWIGMVLGGVMLWSVLGVGLAAVFVFPVLVSQNGGVWWTARQSFLLALDNPGLSLCLLASVFFFMAIGVVSGIGLFCGLLALSALLISVCFRRLSSKYTGISLPGEPPRTWRELFRPWEN